VKRVLITGASGFIGRHCLDALIGKGYEVHAVARRSLAGTRNITWHQVDLLAPGAAAELARHVRASHLLHFAWYTKHGLYWTASDNSKWLSFSIELIDAFADAGGKRAVCAGTCAEYAWNDSVCNERDTPLAPSTPYGRAKVSLHGRLEEMVRERHFSLGWGRIFFPYGPYEDAGRLVPSVINSILRHEPVKCTSGEQRFDYLYVEDIADALVAFLGSDVIGAVNVASGVPVRVRDVVMTLARQLDGIELVRLGALPARDNDPKLLLANVQRLRTEVGWQPALSLDEGLARTIEWWRARNETEEGSTCFQIRRMEVGR
jgi:nucleoside-diphosphate-sugar epimerase